MREKAWSKEDLPSMEVDQVREYLNKLERHEPMGSDVMPPVAG